MRPITLEARTIEVDCLRLVDEGCHVCALDGNGEFLDLLKSFEGEDASGKAHALAERLSRETGLPIKVRYERD